MKCEWKGHLRLGLVLGIAAAGFITAAVCIKPGKSRAALSGIVPLELVLLVDTSSSVDSNEYQVQQDGYSTAFQGQEITDQIEAMGGIAVLYVEWDNASNQIVRLPWTHLQTRTDCLNYAAQVSAIQRESSGTTMLAPALEFARDQLMTNEFHGMRRVIDVSGDGMCKNWRYFEQGITDNGNTDPAHYGVTPWAEVIASLASTVHNVNGVFIGPSGEHLDFYEDVLPHGPDAFALHAMSFNAFANTLEQKIMRELTAKIPGTYD